MKKLILVLILCFVVIFSSCSVDKEGFEGTSFGKMQKIGVSDLASNNPEIINQKVEKKVRLIKVEKKDEDQTLGKGGVIAQVQEDLGIDREEDIEYTLEYPYFAEVKVNETQDFVLILEGNKQLEMNVGSINGSNVSLKVGEGNLTNYSLYDVFEVEKGVYASLIDVSENGVEVALVVEGSYQKGVLNMIEMGEESIYYMDDEMLLIKSIREDEVELVVGSDKISANKRDLIEFGEKYLVLDEIKQNYEGELEVVFQILEPIIVKEKPTEFFLEEKQSQVFYYTKPHLVQVEDIGVNSAWGYYDGQKVSFVDVEPIEVDRDFKLFSKKFRYSKRDDVENYVWFELKDQYKETYVISENNSRQNLLLGEIKEFELGGESFIINVTNISDNYVNLTLDNTSYEFVEGEFYLFGENLLIRAEDIVTNGLNLYIKLALMPYSQIDFDYFGLYGEFNKTHNLLWEKGQETEMFRITNMNGTVYEIEYLNKTININQSGKYVDDELFIKHMGYYDNYILFDIVKIE